MVIRPRALLLSRYLKSCCLHPTDIHYALRLRNCSYLGYIYMEARTFEPNIGSDAACLMFFHRLFSRGLGERSDDGAFVSTFHSIFLVPSVRVLLSAEAPMTDGSVHCLYYETTSSRVNVDSGSFVALHVPSDPLE